MSPSTRAEASQRVRESIVAATVAIVARDGVARPHPPPRRRTRPACRFPRPPGTSPPRATSSRPRCAGPREHEVARIAEIADRLGDAEFDPAAWAEELADWLVEQVTTERDIAVALYRLQIELADSPGARATHHEWGRGLRALGERRARALADARISTSA